MSEGQQGGQGRRASLLKHQYINRTFCLCDVPSAACPLPRVPAVPLGRTGALDTAGTCVSARSRAEHLLQLGFAPLKYAQKVKQLEGNVLPVLGQG